MPSVPGIAKLPRGGALVSTGAGPVQLGCPPESIKDILKLGLEVPAVLVMPRTWFSRRRGLTVAEVEFPVYYNYFVLGRRTTLVCDAGERRRLLVILGESLFGPASAD